MYQDDNAISELNPKPIRIIRTMGDISVIDWVWFILGSCFSLPIYFLVQPGEWFSISSSSYIAIVKMLFCLPVIGISAILAFIQNKQTGKLRTRIARGLKYIFRGKSLNAIQLKSLYAIKEIKENHIHYKTSTTEGVVSCFRIEGFDPSLLESSQVANLIDSLSTFFSVNIRFKILAMRVTYKVPPKKMALSLDHYGVNFAQNRYVERIEDINTNVNLKQQAYFLIIDGPSIQKNMETFGIISSPLGDDMKTRFRLSNFPFTEPSFEVDYSCPFCGGKGCNACKHTGWIEILGCGILHKNVLDAAGIHDKVGLAMGLGVERVAMFKYGINDVRDFYANNFTSMKGYKK